MRTELYEMEENSTITAIRELIDEKLTSIALVQKPFLTTKEVAKYLGLTEAYIRKMTHNREIPHYKPMGKNLYFNREEIDEWVLQSRVATSDEIRAEARQRRRNL